MSRLHSASRRHSATAGIAVAAVLLLTAAVLGGPAAPAEAAPGAGSLAGRASVLSCPATGTWASVVVRWEFMTALERCPDSAGSEYWANQLVTGLASPGSIQLSMLLSNERLDLLIAGQYINAYARQPTSAELTFWTTYLRSTHRLDELFAVLLAGGSVAQGEADAAYVQSVYGFVLNRAGDPGGSSYWEAELANGGSRQDLALALLDSQERATLVVTRQFPEMFGRPVDPAGLAYWSAWQRQHEDWFGLKASLAASTEFRTHAATNPQMS